MAFFTVRATLIGGETGAVRWRFGDRKLAEEKFKEVCGPLCAEAWLLYWTDDPSRRGTKEVYLERHWDPQAGLDCSKKLWGKAEQLFDSPADEITEILDQISDEDIPF
jgi:hypothetical protein